LLFGHLAFLSVIRFPAIHPLVDNIPLLNRMCANINCSFRVP